MLTPIDTTAARWRRIRRLALALSLALSATGDGGAVEAAFATFAPDALRSQSYTSFPSRRRSPRSNCPPLSSAIEDPTMFTSPIGSGSNGGSGPVETTKKRTLYDVLRCPPDASRDDLKAAYVALARESHPDALVRGSQSNDDGRPDFTEVAAAWKTLRDPLSRKRYDRSLKAEKFSEAAEEKINGALEVAVPKVRQFLDAFNFKNKAPVGSQWQQRNKNNGMEDAGMNFAGAATVAPSGESSAFYDRYDPAEAMEEFNESPSYYDSTSSGTAFDFDYRRSAEEEASSDRFDDAFPPSDAMNSSPGYNYNNYYENYDDESSPYDPSPQGYYGQNNGGMSQGYYDRSTDGINDYQEYENGGYVDQSDRNRQYAGQRRALERYDAGYADYNGQYNDYSGQYNANGEYDEQRYADSAYDERETYGRSEEASFRSDDSQIESEAAALVKRRMQEALDHSGWGKGRAATSMAWRFGQDLNPFDRRSNDRRGRGEGSTTERSTETEDGYEYRWY